VLLLGVQDILRCSRDLINPKPVIDFFDVTALFAQSISEDLVVSMMPPYSIATLFGVGKTTIFHVIYKIASNYHLLVSQISILAYMMKRRFGPHQNIRRPVFTPPAIVHK